MTLLLACLLATAFMAGLSWFVGVVHYPLFAAVGVDRWPAYHERHTARTSYVVVLPMLVELVTAAWIVLDPPSGVGRGLAALGFALAVGAWALTAYAASRHARLASAFDPATNRELLLAHHARTALWSAHALVAAVLVAQHGAA